MTQSSEPPSHSVVLIRHLAPKTRKNSAAKALYRCSILRSHFHSLLKVSQHFTQLIKKKSSSQEVSNTSFVRLSAQTHKRSFCTKSINHCFVSYRISEGDIWLIFTVLCHLMRWWGTWWGLWREKTWWCKPHKAWPENHQSRTHCSP